MIDFKKIEEEYLDIQEADDERLFLVEKIMSLSEADRRIFLIWVDLGAYTKTARVFGVHPLTVAKKIKKIKKYLQNDN